MCSTPTGITAIRDRAKRRRCCSPDASTGGRFKDQPVVLLGDFNAVEKNPGIAYLTGTRASVAGQTGIWPHGLIDTFEALHPGNPARTTLHFWKGSRAGTLKVDHILVSKGAQVLAAEIRDRDQPMVSDHFPVTARVVFPD